MKKQATVYIAAGLLVSALAFAGVKAGDVMRRLGDGTCVVNTTTLCPSTKGFKGATPLEVHIKNNKIVKVVALANHETPRYFQKVKTALLPKWEGMSVSKAAKADIDGVTGATFSSRAVKENVRAAALYYKKNK